MKAVELTQWIEDQAGKVRYGDIVLKITLHEGRKTKIEKTVTLREFEGLESGEGGSS